MFSSTIPPSGIGGLTLLESAILVSLAKLADAKKFFEFGTYLGATSLLLATNSSENAEIVTVDLPPEEVAPMSEGQSQAYLHDDKINDRYLSNTYVKTGAIYIDRADADTQKKIRRIQQNSLSIDPDKQGLSKAFDFIFIDGGHDYETVKSDTAKAFKMAKEDAIILWHDYRSNIHKDVTLFVDELSQETKIIHVQNTMLAFTLLGKVSSLISD